jgi:hypothetical protein
MSGKVKVISIARSKYLSGANDYMRLEVVD